MKWRLIGFVFLLAAPARLSADDAALSLADLEAYRLALSAHPDRSASLVRFRDLWDHPEAHVGRQVRVEGRIARILRQPKVGEFPPLVEAWLVSPAGDPFCLIFPQPKPENLLPQVGASVGFTGTFLRRIRYHGGDVDRLAPLIVGPVGPSIPGIVGESEGRSWSTTDWLMAVAVTLIVALILAVRHLARPEPPSPRIDREPTFVDGDVGSDHVEDSEGDAHEVA